MVNIIEDIKITIKFSHFQKATILIKIVEVQVIVKFLRK